jgi:hypothetical protein
VEISEAEAKELGVIPGEQTDITEIQQADNSYLESDCHYWAGQKLEPFSSKRQNAATCLGLRFGNLSREEMEAGLEGRGYPDMIQDVVIVLYLCFPRGKVNAHTGMSESIEESYAACNPGQREKVRRRMLDWAEDQGIEMMSPTLAEASKIMSQILKEEIINRFRLPKPEGKAPKGNS